MEISDTGLALSIFAVILVGFAKGGFAGLGALATPIMALGMAPGDAAAILLPILLVQDPVGLWSFRGQWNWRILKYMFPGAFLGIAIGWGAAASLPIAAMLSILGGTFILFGMWRIWIERQGPVAPSRLPEPLGILFGAASGFMSQVAHAGGPPFQMWVAPKKLPHTQYVGTNMLLFTVMNWIKVPTFWSLGQFHSDQLMFSLKLMPLAIVSTFAGVWLVKRIHGPIFYRIINWLMLLVGARLLWQGVTG